MSSPGDGPSTNFGSETHTKYIPYGRQWLDEDDISSVIEVLRSDWLTTGPKVEEFEKAFAEHVGAREAVAVSNGTAALHSAMFALGIGPGDEVIIPTMTFAASANCVLYQRGSPVFADVDPDTLLLDPEQIRSKITPKTKAIVSVDFAGQPCDYDAIYTIAEEHGLALVSDACHALGGDYKGRNVGTLADMSIFSLHPVKHITSGEGGVVTTDDANLAQRIRKFRNHGISTDHRERERQGSWFYEMEELGYNYRLTDIQCALAMSQLGKLTGWVERRREIAGLYDAAFAEISAINPLKVRPDVSHAYHLYIVRLDLKQLRADRATIFSDMRAEGIGVNVHYIPVHLHPYYRKNQGTEVGQCPAAEAAYEEMISIPIFPKMEQTDIERVIEVVTAVVGRYA